MTQPTCNVFDRNLTDNVWKDALDLQKRPGGKKNHKVKVELLYCIVN